MNDGDQNTTSSLTAAPDSTEESDSDDESDRSCINDLSRDDFGSCVAAFTVNDRLMVVKTEHRLVDVYIL